MFCFLIFIFFVVWAAVWKRSFGYVRLAKIQISLHIRAVWSESSLDAVKIAKAAKLFSYVQRRFWSVWADAQADLSLRLANMSEGTFSHLATHATTVSESRSKTIIPACDEITKKARVKYIKP